MFSTPEGVKLLIESFRDEILSVTVAVNEVRIKKINGKAKKKKYIIRKKNKQ